VHGSSYSIVATENGSDISVKDSSLFLLE